MSRRMNRIMAHISKISFYFLQPEIQEQLAQMQRELNRDLLKPLPATQRPRLRDMNILPSFKAHDAPVSDWIACTNVLLKLIRPHSRTPPTGCVPCKR